MVGVCIRTEKPGIFYDPVLYYCHCDYRDLDDLLYSGSLLTGKIPVSGKKDFHAVISADECIPETGNLYFDRRSVL